MSHRSKRGDSLLPTPPPLPYGQQEASFNGSWRRGGGYSQSDYRSHDPNRSTGTSSYKESRRYAEYERYDSETNLAGDTPPPSLLKTTPSSYVVHPHHSSFHTPPARGYDFSSDDYNSVDLTLQPQGTLSEPLNRHFPPDRRYSHDIPDRRRRSQHEEQDFPRTPLPPGQQRQHKSREFSDALLPPPKLMRRQSEPYDHNQPHSRRMMSDVDYRRRSSGYERGFRGSERAVSLMQNHYEDSSYYRTRHGDR